MGWARIDDGFDDHPKVLALLEHDDGAAAVGLWTLCLTWAHRYTRKKGKTPGLIPAGLPRRYVGAASRELAALLVKEGLWERPDETGWLIHDFGEYLPTAETREARAEAGRRGAEARWAGKRGKSAGRDSNLPSVSYDVDGKPMASEMANDGTGMAAGAVVGAGTPPSGPQRSSDGKLPSSDSNLPSDSHEKMANRMANDGSRAPARRGIPKGIPPEPVPVPMTTSSGAVKPRREPTGNVSDVVSAYIEGATNAGLDRPASTLIARVGKQARQLIAEGKSLDRLIAAAWNMGAGEWNDLAVQLRKDDAAANSRTSPPAHSESTATQRARQAMEAGRQAQALIDGGGP